jgi:HK97 family phage major capsid protein
MPYTNVPEDLWDKMDRCVEEVQAKDDSLDKPAAVAICYASIVEGKSLDFLLDEALKAGARNSARDGERLQAIHDLAVENGAMCKSESALDVEKTLDLAAWGGEIKALAGGHLGGHLVRFGDPEHTDASRQKDFFTPRTDFGMKRGESINSPVYLNHRLPLKTRSGGKVAVREKIGDATLTLDDEGVLIDAILYNRERYEKALPALGWSSGTAQHLVDRRPVKDANEILTWPLGLDASITPTPAEPLNSVIPLKSIGDLLPVIDLDDTGDDGRNINSTKSMEVSMEMTPEQIQALVEQAAAKGAEQALKNLPPVTPSGIQVTKDEADKDWASPGEFFKAVKMAALYPMAEDPRLRPLKATGMSEGIPADGGYLVAPQFATGILERMYDVNSILRLCAQDTVTGNSMIYNGVDESSHASSLYGGLVGYWLGEAATKTGTKPAFYQLTLKLKKIAALCYATDEQLEDTPNLQSWLTRTVPNVLRWYVEEAIVNGDGVGKPTGIMNSPCLVTCNRDTASYIKLADIANMWSRRWRGVNDYVWLIESGASAQLHQMTAATAPVYMPAGNVAGSPFGTLYGRPVIETEHCQALNTTGDIILASLSQYQIITKGGVQAAQSIHVAFTTDETAFRFVYRIDGAPTWNSALTPAHGSSTVSPFVCLVSAST